MDREAWKRSWRERARLLEAGGAGAARLAGTARFRVGPGFRTAIDLGDHALVSDEGRSDGTTGAGPSPAQLVRAGIGACLAQGYLAAALLQDVHLEAVEVEVTCELDLRGQMGLDAGVPIGWQRIAWIARLTSDAPEADLRRIFDEADRLSPMLASLDPAIERDRTLEIVRPAAAPR